MKKIVNSLLLISALGATGAANAYWYRWADLCMNPYIGVDFKETWMRGTSNWSQINSKSYPGATVYAGSRFYDCYGIELGYSGSGRKNRTSYISNGGFFALPGTGSEILSTNIRLQSYHVDINGYYRVDNCGCWDLIGSVGVASMKAKITTTAVTGSFTFAQSDGFNSINGKNRTIARIGVGSQYIFCDIIGARVIARWENTRSLRVQGNRNFGNTLPGVAKKPFKDAVSLALGLFLQF